MKTVKIKKEIELAHGELDVLITPVSKGTRSMNVTTGRPTGFIYELDVQIVDGFNEMTLTIHALMYDFMKWEVKENSWTIKDMGDSDSWSSAFELAEELMVHGFMDAIEKVLN